MEKIRKKKRELRARIMQIALFYIVAGWMLAAIYEATIRSFQIESPSRILILTLFVTITIYLTSFPVTWYLYLYKKTNE